MLLSGLVECQPSLPRRLLFDDKPHTFRCVSALYLLMLCHMGRLPSVLNASLYKVIEHATLAIAFVRLRIILYGGAADHTSLWISDDLFKPWIAKCQPLIRFRGKAQDLPSGFQVTALRELLLLFSMVCSCSPELIARVPST